MVSGWENIGKHHVIAFFFFSIWRQNQAIKIAIRYSQQFSLTTAVRAHACKTVSTSCKTRVHCEAVAGQTTFAVFAKTATDVEWQAHKVTHFDFVNGFADFNDNS